MAKDNMFLDSLKWLVKPFDWPKALYEDLRDWYVIRKVCKDESVQKIFRSNDPEIRFDKIYRLYTVVNIPQDMYDQKFAGARETFLIDQLRKVESLTLRLGISEILYPEFTLITDIPDSFAYVLTLETDKDSLSWMKGLGWLFKMGIWFFIMFLINAIVMKTSGNSIIGWISTIFN